MEKRDYQKSLLFIAVLSVIGLPEEMRRKLEDNFGPISFISDPFDFTFTDYYVPEMGDGIKRFFISFENLISPDQLALAKTITNELEEEFSEDGARRINLDPGLISESNLILATTKNRSHRIAIGMKLYAEVTLIYQNHGWVSFPWTYADYKSERVQNEMLGFRRLYLEKLKEERRKK